MATRVTLRDDLDGLVAARFLRPHVQRVRDDLLAEARRRAPGARTWHCLAPDTAVMAWGVDAASRRTYVGPLVRCTTVSGRTFAATPEHQVLTGYGWLQAQDVREGDCLFQIVGTEPAWAPHVEDPPTRFGQVVDAVMQAAPSGQVWAVGMRMNLHGDPWLDSKVDVVAADRELRRHLQPRCGEGLVDGPFIDAHDLGESTRFGGGDSGHPLRLPDRALLRWDEMSGAAFTDGWRLAAQPERGCGGAVPHQDLLVSEDVPDRWLRDAVDAAQVALRGTRSVVAHDVGGDGSTLLGALSHASAVCPVHGLGVAAVGAGAVAGIGGAGGEDGAALAQAPSHGLGAAAEFGRDLAGRLSRLVSADHVIDIQWDWHSGHVYDLSTDRGWFLADGLIVHNSARDERVRQAHVAADGQTIPGNLRFRVPRPSADVSGFQWYAVGGDVELARAPRDPDLSIGNRARCRCSAVPVPGAVARSIHSGPVTVQGPRVAAVVETRFPRVVESEFPGAGDTGGGWMRGAVNEVAARTAASARGT